MARTFSSSTHYYRNNSSTYPVRFGREKVAFTCLARANSSDSGSFDATILGLAKFTSPYTTQIFFKRRVSFGFSVRVIDGTGNDLDVYDSSQMGSIPLGQWFSVAGTVAQYQGGINLAVYHNGERKKDGSSNMSLAPMDNINCVGIGRRPINVNSWHWRGDIGEVALFERVLSPDEIWAHAQGVSAASFNPDHLWLMGPTDPGRDFAGTWDLTQSSDGGYVDEPPMGVHARSRIFDLRRYPALEVPAAGGGGGAYAALRASRAVSSNLGAAA